MSFNACFESEYYRCDECNAIIHSDNVESVGSRYYCPDCYISREDDDDGDEYGPIHEYSYRPTPILYGTGIHYGIELEVDKGGRSSENAEKVLDAANHYDEHIYIKQDSSLNNGFELVTHPMSYDYHMNEMPWSEVLRLLSNLGYCSHDTITSGIHIHVERSALGDDFEEEEETIAKILFFVEQNWDALLVFSRRTVEQMRKWSSRYGNKDSPKELMEHAKKSDLGRYTCVNLKNRNTIEFRMFRGTLKINSFIAILQLVDAICKMAIMLSEEEIQCLGWAGFVQRLKTEDRPELMKYLKFKGLVPNEGEA